MLVKPLSLYIDLITTSPPPPCRSPLISVVDAHCSDRKVMSPPAAFPSHGAVEVSVECAASLFSGTQSRRDDVNSHLSDAVTRLLQDSLPLSSLCVMPGRFAWQLHIDAIVLSNDGNMLDAVSCAVWAALRNTRLPSLIPVRAEAGFEDDFQLESSAEKAVPLQAGQLPINVTLTLIGDDFIFDATQHEEACATSRMSVAVNRGGDFFGVYLAGNCSVPPDQFPVLMEAAKQAARSMLDGLEANDQSVSSVNEICSHPDAPLTAVGLFS